MPQATYSLTYDGSIREGFDAESVRERVIRLLGLNEVQSEKVFSGRPVVLRHGLNEDDAVHFCARLNSIGMGVKVRHDADTASSSDARREPTFGPTDSASGGAAPPAVADSTASADGADARVVAFEFHGNGAEYFRIWIVNILLSIVTLGIYSAWAKVRTQRYFYGNTRLDGSSFEYLADPLKILKGRLIGFVLLLLYTFSDQFSPWLGLVAIVLFMVAMPWMVMRGLAFRNHNSTWRGVRFGFDGSLGDAYKAYLMWPVLGVLSLGTLMPYALYRQIRFAIEGSRFGTSRFRFDGGPKRVYVIMGAVTGVAIAGVLASVLLGFVFGLLSPFVMAAGYIAAFALFGAWMANYRFNHTRVDGHLLEADYAFGSYAKLVFVNTLLMVCTLGLFYPWARVRTAHYAAAHTRVVASGDVGAFVAARQQEESATGGEIGDLFDVDFGF